jgi:RNA polymerase sigma-70 factor (ECF subfamily)
MGKRSEEQEDGSQRVVPAFVLRLRSGDPASAWTLFLSAYSTNLMKVIRRLATDEESRSDCFVFVCEHLRAQDCRRLARFEPDGTARFTTWLYSVTWNLCLDWKRTQRPHLHLVGLDDADIDDAPAVRENALAHNPAVQVEQQMDRTRLARALDRLPAQDRLLIRLRYEKELTLAELARISGLANAQAVDRRLRALLAVLQAEMHRSAAENPVTDSCQEAEARDLPSGSGV